jgi:c-di-GMP-binding flagellar brake protein YcgR
LFHTDALFPRSAERKLVAGETDVDFAFEVNDVKYRFTARFEGAGAWEGFDALTFALPTEIDESQRRGFYRVAPRTAEPVKLFTGPDLSEATTALDLSAGGISFRVSRDVAAEARFQGIVVLPDETVVETTLEVIDCYAMPGAASQPYRVRARYASLTPADREVIARYVCRRQREMIRTTLS